eukprot:6091840-Pleurochrysis_carterae.AAC.1
MGLTTVSFGHALAVKTYVVAIFAANYFIVYDGADAGADVVAAAAAITPAIASHIQPLLRPVSSLNAHAHAHAHAQLRTTGAADADLAPTVDESHNSYYAMLLVFFTLLVGELLSYSVKFLQKLAHIRLLEEAKLKAQAELRARDAEAAVKAELANVQRLEAQKRVDSANRSADSRLNHVIKGHCGTAIASL